jgi:hypothetical protein
MDSHLWMPPCRWYLPEQDPRSDVLHCYDTSSYARARASQLINSIICPIDFLENLVWLSANMVLQSFSYHPLNEQANFMHFATTLYIEISLLQKLWFSHSCRWQQASAAPQLLVRERPVLTKFLKNAEAKTYFVNTQ